MKIRQCPRLVTLNRARGSPPPFPTRLSFKFKPQDAHRSRYVFTVTSSQTHCKQSSVKNTVRVMRVQAECIGANSGIYLRHWSRRPSSFTSSFRVLFSCSVLRIKMWAHRTCTCLILLVRTGCDTSVETSGFVWSMTVDPQTL